MSDSQSKLRILIVEDNESMREGMVQVLRKEGHDVSEATNGSEGLSQAATRPFDLVITDYRMAGTDGLQLLKEIKKKAAETEVIVITAFGTIELAVEAMKAGAWDFIQKPFTKDELKLKVQRVIHVIQGRQASRRLIEENRYLKEEVESCFNFGEIIGQSPRMQEIYKTIGKVAASDTSIMIYGESGTGKELVARAIHQNSPRAEKPFVRVNCGALAEGVLESELFGHEKGAFTNAYRQKKGRFELAAHGTLFLDEIGDIPLSTQVKLLRVLQEKEFERVGGEETIRVDVRVITATNKDLMKEVEEGRFREDLYYRLHILPIHMPPLRERREDIPLLADHFLSRLSRERRKPDLQISEDGMALLTQYQWPGNVRELENVLERAVVLAEKSDITGESLAFMVSKPKGTKIADTTMNLNDTLAAVEKEKLLQALDQTNGVKARAARLLGLKESALYYKLEKYGLLDRSKE